MSITIKKTLAEVSQEAISLLCKEIGVVNTLRFINQFTNGYGDYTKEREELFNGMSLNDIISEIKSMRK